MTEILSLWRSPIDKVAFREAEALRDRQPKCTTTIPYGADFDPMSIYNYGYYVDTYPLSYDDALQHMFDDMASPPSSISPPLASAGGGTAFIPQQTFAVSAYAATAIPVNVPDQCNIIASGGGGTQGGGGTDFFHFVITPTAGPTNPSYFFYCTGGHTSGGKYFRNIAFKWTTTSVATDTCLFAGTWNCRAINCTFTDCPTALDGEGESDTLEQCTINYSVTKATGPNNTTAVILAGPQMGVIGPGEFFQNPQNGLLSGGPEGCTCIAVRGQAEHAVISKMHISDWTIGIDFSQKANSRYTNITDCEIQSFYTCINIQLPASANNPTWGIKVSNCFLARTQDSTTFGPVVLIDTNGNNNSMLSDIEISNCTVTTIQNAGIQPSNAYGLQINGGENIRILGGMFSNFSPTGGAGIAITGAVGNTQIIGCNLRPSYPNAPHSYSQQYALLVSGSPADTVVVDSCDMGGGYSSPVLVSGTITSGTLFITNCHGYNDLNTPIAPSAPTASGGASAATASSITGGIDYYGPSLVIFTNGSSTLTFTVNGVASTVPKNAFVTCYIASPYDVIKFSATPAQFAWLGK